MGSEPQGPALSTPTEHPCSSSLLIPAPPAREKKVAHPWEAAGRGEQLMVPPLKSQCPQEPGHSKAPRGQWHGAG